MAVFIYTIHINPSPRLLQSTLFTKSSPRWRHTHRLPLALDSENRDSVVKRKALQSARHHQCEHWPTHVSYSNKLQSCWQAHEDNEHSVEHPCDGFWEFAFKFFCHANWWLQQLSRWLVSDNLQFEDAGCGGPVLFLLKAVRQVGWTAKLSEMPLETSWEINLPFKGNSIVIETAHFRVGRLRHTCAIIIRFNYHLDT